MRKGYQVGLVLVLAVAVSSVALASGDAGDPGRGRPLPRVGTMTGMSGASTVQLTLDRNDWTIKGVFDQDPVAVAIDHDGGAVTGSAHGSPLDLTFNWSPDRIIYGGTAYGQAVRVSLGWHTGWLTGKVGATNIRLQFDLQAGTLSGQVGPETTDLRLDAVSGVLKGTWAGQTLNLKLVNLDLSDFIQYFYLFLD